MWYFIINVYTINEIVRQFIDAFPHINGCNLALVYDALRYFIKFVHLVLEISATTISSGIDLSVQFIRHLLIFDASGIKNSI